MPPFYAGDEFARIRATTLVSGQGRSRQVSYGRNVEHLQQLGPPKEDHRLRAGSRDRSYSVFRSGRGTRQRPRASATQRPKSGRAINQERISDPRAIGARNKTTVHGPTPGLSDRRWLDGWNERKRNH